MKRLKETEPSALFCRIQHLCLMSDLPYGVYAISPVPWSVVTSDLCHRGLFSPFVSMYCQYWSHSMLWTLRPFLKFNPYSRTAPACIAHACGKGLHLLVSSLRRRMFYLYSHLREVPIWHPPTPCLPKTLHSTWKCERPYILLVDINIHLSDVPPGHPLF